MQLTAPQIKLIKTSWGTFRNINPIVISDVFYSRLFFRHPELRKLFTTKNGESTNFLTIISVLISSLDRKNEIDRQIQQFATKLGEFADAKYYTAISEAMLWTIKEGLGDDWKTEMEQAWSDCYKMISILMLEIQSMRV